MMNIALGSKYMDPDCLYEKFFKYQISRQEPRHVLNLIPND